MIEGSLKPLFRPQPSPYFYQHRRFAAYHEQGQAPAPHAQTIFRLPYLIPNHPAANTAMPHLIANLQAIRNQIAQAEAQARRPAGSVQLIAVSKTFPADAIRTLYQHGQHHFGENYIQEWRDKTHQLADCPHIVWHIIGNVQSNKSRLVAERAHWLHTLDSEKLARRLSSQRPAHLPDLQVLLEINIANDPAKHGIAPETLLPLAQTVAPLPRLNLRGLMCVASHTDHHGQLRQQFTQMRHLLAQLQTIAPQADTLSMGMSGDMVLAIECGATMVRIGSAIFGKRDYPNAA